MIMIIVTCNKFYCDAQDKSLKLAGAERGAANVHKLDCDEEEKKHFWRASQRHTNQDRYFGLLFKEEINYILIILVLIIIILYN